jgi:hypothetical protein
LRQEDPKVRPAWAISEDPISRGGEGRIEQGREGKGREERNKKKSIEGRLISI